MSVLHLFCGKIAAGKSTLAAQLAQEPNSVLISQDQWLSQLFPGEIKTLPGRIMYHLVASLQTGSSKPLPTTINVKRASDIAYFNARLAQMLGRNEEYRTHLELVLKDAKPNEWPVLLANRMLEQADYAQPPMILPPEDPSLPVPVGSAAP